MMFLLSVLRLSSFLLPICLQAILLFSSIACSINCHYKGFRRFGMRDLTLGTS